MSSAFGRWRKVGYLRRSGREEYIWEEGEGITYVGKGECRVYLDTEK